MTRSIRVFARFSRFILASIVLLGVVAACGNEEEKISEDNPVIEGAPASPAAGTAIPDDVEETSMSIEGGKIDTDRLTLQEDEPVVIHVTNADGQEYRLRMGDLVAGVRIAPSGTTDVALNAPNAVEVEGELLPATGEEPLDTFDVIVQGPSGASP